MSDNYMEENDMIFSKSENGNITGGGFCINSLFMKNINENGVSPIQTINSIHGGMRKGTYIDTEETDDEDSDDNNNEKSYNTINFNSDVNIKSIVVPFGLFYKQEKMMKSSLGKQKKENDLDDDNEISDVIYDELLKMVTVNDKLSDDKKSHISKKATTSIKTKTKKHKTKIVEKTISKHKKTAKHHNTITS
jgi:hypothetical protein